MAGVEEAEESSRRADSARETEERVQERPRRLEGSVDREETDFFDVGAREEEAKRISPMCAIVAASSQGVPGVRVAGISPFGGGEG